MITLDDVADLLHVDREADDVGPAAAFLLAQRLARDARHVVLDGRVELVHRVVELAQLLRQPQVVVADHVQDADQHGLPTSAWCSASRAALEMASEGLGHQLRQADEAHADHHVECQVEEHHPVRLVRQLGLHVADPQADEGRHDGHAQRLEEQVAHGHLPYRDGRLGRGQHRQQAAAQVGAEHQPKRHVQRHHVRAGHGRHQQHHREARVGHDGQHRADGDLSSTSLLIEASSARMAGEENRGSVASTTSCSASSISPSPISTRPTRPATVAERVMKSTTPTKMNIGESHERSAENSTEISAVPMSAPRITARAAGSVTSPARRRRRS
ncbi:hypothetical protein DdX_21421 [Ditylenchus destructor]|uniref:Uncharacterized protein n=1 Tax=Ditylenchus destructor TaxID=166010 RepID=A0AAD4QVK1_9BILA|nr:hypothetical protein DdX_21421 [Ditylenchus destructor]